MSPWRRVERIEFFIFHFICPVSFDRMNQEEKTFVVSFLPSCAVLTSSRVQTVVISLPFISVSLYFSRLQRNRALRCWRASRRRQRCTWSEITRVKEYGFSFLFFIPSSCSTVSQKERNRTATFPQPGTKCLFFFYTMAALEIDPLATLEESNEISSFKIFHSP